MNFFDSQAGHDFAMRTVPRMVAAITENNELLKKQNELTTKLIEIETNAMAKLIEIEKSKEAMPNPNMPKHKCLCKHPIVREESPEICEICFGRTGLPNTHEE